MDTEEKGKESMKKKQISVVRMPQENQQAVQTAKKRTRWSILFSAGLLLLVLLIVSILMIPVGKLMLQEGGKEQIIEKIQSFGIFAPLLFVLLQVVQIVPALPVIPMLLLAILSAEYHRDNGLQMAEAFRFLKSNRETLYAILQVVENVHM